MFINYHGNLEDGAEAINRFTARFDACTKQVGGRTAWDSKAIRSLVHAEPEAADLVVKLYCQMGQSEHGYFQGAALIGAAYYYEFKDESLLRWVLEHAKAAGAEKSLAKFVRQNQDLPSFGPW